MRSTPQSGRPSPMLLRLKGARIYDPANGVDGEIRDLYLRDGRIVVDPGRRRADRPRLRSGRPGGHGGCHRHAHPHRRRQAQHRPRHAARGPSRRPGGPHRPDPRLLRARGARHLRHRLPLRRDGLHRLFRAGDPAGQRPPGPSGDGRHADRGQGRVRHAGQRRLPAPPDGRRLGPEADQRLRRVDPARDPLHRHQGGQSGRHLRLQVQPAEDGPGRAALLLRCHSAGHPPRPEPGGARAGRAPSAPRAQQQPRPAGQRRHDAGHHPRPPKGCRSI